MESNEKTEKYEYLEYFLTELFSVSSQAESPSITSDQVINMRSEPEELAVSMSNQWIDLYKNAQGFRAIRETYKEKFLPWSEKLKDFKSAKENGNLHEFIKKNFSAWENLNFEYKNTEPEEIEDLIYQEKPHISFFYDEFDGEFVNLLLFSSPFLELIAHLKLEKNIVGTYSLLIVFSFWEVSSNFNPSLDFESIAEKFWMEYLAKHLFNKLKAIGYDEIPEVYPNEDHPSLGQMLDNFSMSVRIFQPATSWALHILSDNPLILFRRFIEHLKSVEEIEENLTKEKNNSPLTWYENLPVQMKDFLVKGRELLYQLEDLYRVQEEFTEKDKDTSKKIQDEDLFQELVMGIFRKEYINDKTDKSIEDSDKGYRSLNEIYKKYQETIDMSLPTFYNHFRELNTTLFLEHRRKPGIGGGDQYRYKTLERKSPKELEIPQTKEINEIDIKNYQLQKIKLQEAIIHYKQKNYQNSIDIIDSILKNPSDGFRQDKILYPGAKFYLALSYYHIKDFKKSYRILDRITIPQEELIDVAHYKILCQFFLGKYEDSLSKTTDLIEMIENIIFESDLGVDYLKVGMNQFHHYDLEDINQDQIKKADLSKHFIKFKIEENPIEFEPSFHRRDIEEPELFKKKFESNMYSLRKIYFILRELAYLRFENSRRIIFQNIIEQNVAKIDEIMVNLISYNNKITEKYNFIENRYLSFQIYFSYFRDLFDLFGLETLIHKIKKAYPELKGVKIDLPTWDEYPINQFKIQVNHINSYFRSVYQNSRLHSNVLMKSNEDYIEFEVYNEKLRLYKDEKDLISEDYIIRAKIIENYSIQKAIEDYKEFKNVNVKNEEEFDKIFRKIDYYYKYKYYRNDKPIVYLELIKEAINYCKEHGLKTHNNVLQEIYTNIQNKFRTFLGVKNQFESFLFNRLCEIFQTQFTQNSNTFRLELEHIPEKSLYWMVIDGVMRKVADIIKEKPKNYNFIIELFDTQIIDEVLEIIREKDNYYNYFRLNRFEIDKNIKLQKNIQDGTIHISIELILDISDYKGPFEEKLDYIYYALLGVVRYGITEFTLKTGKKQLNKFHDYFENQFESDYYNDFIQFKAEWISSESKYLIKINKRDDKN